MGARNKKYSMEKKNKKDLAFAIICVIIIALLCCSCRCAKTCVVEVVRTDTIRETNTVIEYVPDTIYIEVPAEEKERTTKDSTSHLETSYAESNARINKDGTLYHDLSNKSGKRPVEVKTKVVTVTKTLAINNKKEKTITIEKKLSLWKKMAIKFFPWLLTTVVGLLGYTFRKPLLKLIRMII